jgi:nucleotide-binding universal stress UspA family protein
VNANGENVSIRRILLAMDPSYRSKGALESAAELAGSLDAELTAIFVEDVHLLHLAALPFAGEIGSLSCCLRPLTLEDLERQMRAQAGEMRKALESAASKLGIRWSFQVKRGLVASEILLASMDADLVILGKRGLNLSRRLGSTVQLMISSGRGMALVLQQGERLKVPVVAIYNESPNASKVLDAARTLPLSRKGE